MENIDEQTLDKYQKMNEPDFLINLIAHNMGKELQILDKNDNSIKEFKITPKLLVKIEDLENDINSIARFEYSIIKKSLQSITDEDAIEVAKILYPSGKWLVYDQQKSNFIKALWDLNKSDSAYIYNDLSFGGESHDIDYYNLPSVYQYLESKGYALPHMGYSVDELIKNKFYLIKD